MSWEIDVDGARIKSSEDGLSSPLVGLVEDWVADNYGVINTQPYPSSIEYDPKSETMVLCAHIQFYESVGVPVTVVRSTVPSVYIQTGRDVESGYGTVN